MTRLSTVRGALGGLALALPLALSAQKGTEPVRILFIGNSFLHGGFQPVKSYNTGEVVDENANLAEGDPRAEGKDGPYGGIPAIFKVFTEETRLNYDVHTELSSGKTLEFHYVNALSLIGQAKWNAVVMHDYSTGPAPVARGGNPERFTKYADLLEQAVHAANKSADVYLYETWSRADLTYPDKGPYHGQPIEAMSSDLHAAYYGEAATNGHFRAVVPAGDAWMRAIHSGVAEADPYHHEAGKIDLWGADSYHPSIYGSYLNALVLFEQITGRDSRALGAGERAAAALGISAEWAQKLQTIAHEEVKAPRSDK